MVIISMNQLLGDGCIIYASNDSRSFEAAVPDLDHYSQVKVLDYLQMEGAPSLQEAAVNMCFNPANWLLAQFNSQQA